MGELLAKNDEAISKALSLAGVSASKTQWTANKMTVNNNLAERIILFKCQYVAIVTLVNNPQRIALFFDYFR